jgi:hypothetical protein
MRLSIEEFASKFSALLFGEEGRKYIAHNTRQSIQSWYAHLPEDWFDNKEPFPDGTPRHAGARTFMHPLSTSWEYELTDAGFNLNFKHARTKDGSSSNWGLRLQQFGGWIRPVKKKALTIPVTEDARGKTVRAFQVHYGRKLFKVGNAEGEKIGTLAWEDPAGDLHAAYVLRKSSYVKPLKDRRGHDAVPSQSQLKEWAAKHYTNFIKALEYI